MKRVILVIDDSPTIRNLVSFVLKKENYTVITAEDGLDGLEKLYSAEKVDLIISDINMPRMDGFVFLQNVRQQEAFHTIPIIMLSTESSDLDKEQSRLLGANLHLAKPIQPDSLAAQIKMIMGS